MPPRRTGVVYALLAGASLALLAYLGAVQFASDAFAAPQAATPDSLPSRIPIGWAEKTFELMDRAAPAPFVEETLARAALDARDPARAERYATRLPATPERNELLARVAEERGQPVLALEYFLAAPDIDAVRSRAAQLVATDPSAALDLQRRLRDRLLDLKTHPDAVAEADWQMGVIASGEARTSVTAARRAALSRQALHDYQRALVAAPFSAKYGLSAANQAYTMGDVTDAALWYRQTADEDPASADAVAGLGLVALQRGQRADAQRMLARAQAIDPRAPMVLVLIRGLR